MRRRRDKTTSVSFFAFQDIITSVVGIFVLITLIMVLELAQTVENAQASSSEHVSNDLLAALASLEAELEMMQQEYDALSSSQSAAVNINRFNRELATKNAQVKLDQTRQRIKRIEAEVQDTQQSIVEAKKITEQIIAQGKATESEREELKDLQDKRREIERYTAVLEIDKPLIFRDQTQEGRSVVLIRLEDSKILITDSTDDANVEFTGASRISKFKTWLSGLEPSSRQILLIVKPTGVSDFENVQMALDAGRIPWGFDVAAADSNFKLHCELEKP